MKHFSPLPFLIGMFFLAVVAVGCDDDNDNKVSSTPSVSVSLSDVSANSAVINLTTNAISQYAYICVEDTSTVVYDDEAVLFRTGETVSVSDGDNELTIYPIYPNTYYILYLAFQQTDGSYYGEVISLAFMTTDVNEEGLTLVSTSYDGFSMYIKVPESTITAGNAIRYFARNVAIDYYCRSLDRDISTDLQTNGQVYTMEDVTATYSNDYMTDEDGNLTGDPFVPGEPIYFYAGEYSYGEPPYANWSYGYWVPEFTDDGTGYYEEMLFRLKMPTELDADLNVSVSTTSTSAEIYVDPDDEILMWTAMVVDEDSYMAYVLPYLGYNEDYAQWFVTSYFAYYMSWTGTYTGSGYVDASDLNIADGGYGLIPETKYYFFIVGFGDDEGGTQVFEKVEFTTDEKTLTVPEVVVTALDADPDTGTASPYEAWFNIKAPNGDLVSASYVAEYLDMWRGYTPSDLLSSYGTSFSDSEVAAINSSDGYNVYFASRAGSTTRLAVLGYNEEYTTNSDDLDSDNPTSVADCSTIEAEAKTRVESTLFDDLCGDWTLTLTTSASSTRTKKVSIMQEIEYTSTVPDDYNDSGAYDGKTRAYVDSLWTDYTNSCAHFNKYDLYNQNRLLCIGYAGFNTATSYDLFTSTSYSAYDTDELIYDFGPKWYLEVLDDNTVAMPINYVRQLPCSSWGTYTYYMVGGYAMSSDFIPYDSDYGDVYFEVTLSDDKNTLTISPIYENSTYYYPNLFYISSSYALTWSGTICASDVVLTRGYTEEETAAASVAAKTSESEASEPTHRLRRSALRGAGAAPAKEYKHLTPIERKW